MRQFFYNQVDEAGRFLGTCQCLLTTNAFLTDKETDKILAFFYFLKKSGREKLKKGSEQEKVYSDMAGLNTYEQESKFVNFLPVECILFF